MLKTLVLITAASLSQNIPTHKVPEPQIQRNEIPAVPYQQFNYFYQQPYQPRYYVRPQPQVIYPYRLQPGDLLIPQRIGIFGWRREYKIYRTR